MLQGSALGRQGELCASAPCPHPCTPPPAPGPAQAKDTQDEKRNTGGDTFAVRVVSADGKIEGVSHVTDNNNGTYQVRCPPTASASHLSSAWLHVWMRGGGHAMAARSTA